MNIDNGKRSCKQYADGVWQCCAGTGTGGADLYGADRRCEWFAGDDSDGWKYDVAGADGGSGEPQYG